MKSESIIDERDSVIGDSIDEISKSMPDIQNEIWKKFIKFLKELDTDSEGNLKTTSKNLKAVTHFVYKDVAGVIRNDEYKELINKMLGVFTESSDLTDKYFDTIAEK